MSEPTPAPPTLDELLDRTPEGLAAARQRAAWAEAKAAPPAPPPPRRRRRWGPVVLVALTVILAGERAATWLMREDRAVESLAP